MSSIKRNGIMFSTILSVVIGGFKTKWTDLCVKKVDKAAPSKTMLRSG